MARSRVKGRAGHVDIWLPEYFDGLRWRPSTHVVPSWSRKLCMHDVRKHRELTGVHYRPGRYTAATAPTKKPRRKGKR